MPTNNCDGCNEIGQCSIYEVVIDSRLECPCMECLLKSICVDMCSPRMTLFANIFNGMYKNG